MLSIFSKVIIYNYNDMAFTLVRSLGMQDGSDYFPYVSFFRSDNVDAVNNAITFFMLTKFGPILGANILVVFYILLALFFSYKLFFKLAGDKRISVLFSIFYVFSVYFLYRIISSTFNLYQIFFFPMVFYLLLYKKLSAWKLGALVFLLFAYSSYYAYFCGVVIIFWFLAEAIFSEKRSLEKIKGFIKNSVLFVLPVLILLSIFFSSLLIQHIPFFGNTEQKITKNIEDKSYRPLDDYYSFSFRPWYFIIPPKNSIYFGEFSRNVYEKIQETNYYLADDYTESEAAGSFFGWHFLGGLLFVVFLIFIKSKKGYFQSRFPTVISNKKLIIKLLFVMFLILLISHPPSFTVSGITVHTPSIFVYYVVPVFRTLVRWSVVLYLIILMINSLLVVDLLKNAKKPLLKNIVLFTLVTITYVMTAVSIPIADISSPPEEIEFLSNIKSKSKIAVYPEATYYSTFWVLAHKHQLVNPVGLSPTFYKVDVPLLNVEIPTMLGKENLKNLGVEYLVVYPKDIKDHDNNAILDNLNSVYSDSVFASPKAIIYKLDNNDT